MTDETFTTREDDADDNRDEEPGFNWPSVYIDGELQMIEDTSELDRVQISFEAAENGMQSEADERAPLGWVNSAAITLEREDDSITLSISLGDPRGAFAFTVRRTPAGELLMHFPTPQDGMLHRPLREIHRGTYKIG